MVDFGQRNEKVRRTGQEELSEWRYVYDSADNSGRMILREMIVSNSSSLEEGDADNSGRMILREMIAEAYWLGRQQISKSVSTLEHG